MFNIVHDWPLEKVKLLFRKSYAALNTGGRLVLCELLLHENATETSIAASGMNIIMLQWTQGRQYSVSELTVFASETGFVEVNTCRLSGDYSLLTAIK